MQSRSPFRLGKLRGNDGDSTRRKRARQFRKVQQVIHSQQRKHAMAPHCRMLTTTLLATAFATAAPAQDLGRVSFKTSCTPAAQEKFDRGVALVHSFFYPDSVKAFTEAAETDPQCAIAYWG